METYQYFLIAIALIVFKWSIIKYALGSSTRRLVKKDLEYKIADWERIEFQKLPSPHIKILDQNTSINSEDHSSDTLVSDEKFLQYLRAMQINVDYANHPVLLLQLEKACIAKWWVDSLTLLLGMLSYAGAILGVIDILQHKEPLYILPLSLIVFVLIFNFYLVLRAHKYLMKVEKSIRQFQSS